MLSIKHNFLFIHVPKTGGNSLQSVLRQYSEDVILANKPHQDGWERFEVTNHLDLHKHSTLNEYRNKLDDETYERLFKFSVVRNPWERMISLYFTPNSGRSEWSREQFIRTVEKAETLQEYVRTVGLGAKIKRLLRGANVVPLDGEIDYLIRFESLQEGFDSVCSCIGLPKTDLPVFNVSARTHYTDYYDSDLRTLVHSKFREEIDFCGYTFEGCKS